MQRNIYLEGELGIKFGSKMSYNAPTVADVMKLIEVNNDDFRPYLIQAHEKGIGFHIDVAGEEIEYDEELFLPLHEGDITITPIPAGAKGGGGKILAAILIITLLVVSGGAAGGAAVHRSAQCREIAAVARVRRSVVRQLAQRTPACTPFHRNV